MQSLTPVAEHNPSGAGAGTVLAALQGVSGTRRWSFRYQLLNSAMTHIADLDNVLSGEVNMSWLADIKRTARFRLTETGQIDFLSDLIKPWARLHLPPYGTDDWVEWPLGVFMLKSPERHDEPASGVIIRDVEAFDQLLTFADDKVTTRYTVTAGTVVTTQVSTLLGSIPKLITVSVSTVPADKEYEPGTSKLAVINDLLSSINYNSLSFDENGYALVQPYVTPSARPIEYTYTDDDTSIIIAGAGQTLDLFSVANQWTVVVSEPDRPLLVSTYTNNEPTSPTSTVNRQRTIVDFRTEQDAADQAALNAKVARLAFEASQVYESVNWSSGINPLHSGNDVLWISYSPLAVNARYSEVEWTLPLTAGARMSHRTRRVVDV